jgi:hypothetical protein
MSDHLQPFKDVSQRFTSPMRIRVDGEIIYDPYEADPRAQAPGHVLTKLDAAEDAAPTADAVTPRRTARDVVAGLAARRARRQVGADRA